MNEKNINSIINDLNEFSENLLEQITDREISLENEACYLVKESWYNEFIENENINQINFPEFIYDFNDIISCIQNEQKFKFICKKFFYQLYNKKDLKNTKFINYYTGNNSIIIELEKNKENKALLIRNYTEENEIMKNAYIILLEEKFQSKKNKIKLYNKILLSNNSKKDDIMNVIIPFKAFIILLNEYEIKLEEKINPYKNNIQILMMQIKN